jgi:hypothetical protein
MCTGAGIVSMRAVRSIMGLDVARVVGAWWVVGCTAYMVVIVEEGGFVGAGRASCCSQLSISVSVWGSGVEYYVLRVSTGIFDVLLHCRATEGKKWSMAFGPVNYL